MRRFVLITHKEGNNSVDLIGQMKQLNSISRAPLLPPLFVVFLGCFNGGVVLASSPAVE